MQHAITRGSRNMISLGCHALSKLHQTTVPCENNIHRAVAKLTSQAICKRVMLCGPLYTPTVHALPYTDSLHNCLVWPPRPLTHWAAIRQAEICLAIGYRDDSESRDWLLNKFKCSRNCHVPQCCQDACQILEQMDIRRNFEKSQDRVVRPCRSGNE